MAGSIKGLIVEIGGDTSGLQKALKSVNSATSSLSKELRGVNSLLKLDPSNTTLLAQKQKILANEIDSTSKKLEALKNAQNQADNAMKNGAKISEENYRNLQREIVKTENDLKQLQLQASKWTQAGAKIEEFSNKIKNVSKTLDNLGNTFTTRLTLPVLAIGTAAVTTGNDFEAQMSRVQAIAGATADELEQLTNQAIDLGASTSFSASEVAAGMENLASAGFTTQEIMDAMPGLLDLAASSGADLARSSEIAASAIRGFGLEANSSAHIADVFAEASARTNAQVEDMGEAMKYIAPVANTMGLSIEEVAAAIGIMSDAGIKGEQAGTTLRGALTRLTKPTDKMVAVMDELGISFYDNEGKMKSLTEMISMLQDATSGLTEEQQQYALTTLFGTESLSGMVALISRGSDDLADMTKEFENADGAAKDMADTMLDNTKGSIEELKGSLESAGIAIQKSLSPFIRDLAKKIQDLVDDFNDLTDEEKENVIKTALLVAAIGPAIKILSAFGSTLGTVGKGISVVTTGIGVFRTGAQSASSAANIFAKVLKGITSPAGLVTTAITVATGAIIYFATKQTEAQKKAQETAEAVSETKQSFEQYTASIDKNTQSEINHIEYVRRLSEELGRLVDENGKVKEGYESRVSFILNELNSALGTEYELNNGIIDSYKKLQGEIGETIEKKEAQLILQGEEEKQVEAINAEKEAWKQINDVLDQLGMSYEEAKKKVDDWYNAQQKLISEASYLMTDDEKSAYETYTDKEIQAMETLVQSYEDASSTFKQSVDTQKQYQEDYALFVEGKYNEIGSTIKDTVKDYSNNTELELKNNILRQVQLLDRNKKLYEKYGSDVAKEQYEQSQENLRILAEELSSRAQLPHILGAFEIEAWKSLGKNCYSVYSEEIGKLPETMQNQIQKATGIVIANTPEFATKAGEMGKQVAENFDKNETARQSALKTLQGFYEGLNDEEKKELLKKTVGKRADEVAKEFEKGDYETSGKNVLKGLYSGLSNRSLGSSLVNKAAQIAKNIANQFNIEWDEHSPSKLMKKKTEYFLSPILTVFSKEESKLVKKAKEVARDISEGFSTQFNSSGVLLPNLSGINSEIKRQSGIISMTPQITFNVQKMDEQNLEVCFAYINRKFGTKY